MEKIYSCEDVAKRYDVKKSTVWSWIREQKLLAVRIGKGYRIKEADLDSFEQQNRTDKR